MSNRKKVLNFVTLTIFIFLFIFIVIGWTCNDLYFNYNVIWYCDDPKIEFATGYRSDNDVLCLDEVTYKISVAYANDGSGADIYDDTVDIHSDDSLIWECVTELKKNKSGEKVLYMTIVKDNVSDYEGKTIVLKQRPIENSTDQTL